MLKPNLALVTTRQVTDLPFNHILASRFVTEYKMVSTDRNCYLFPLYVYPDEDAATLFDDTAISPWPEDPNHGDRVPNLSKPFVDDFVGKLGLDFDPHKTGNTSSDSFGPQDVAAYIYSILHSPTYRERYAEFLKIDFPRVPLTSEVDLFWSLVGLGSELIDLHLMEHPKLSETITSFPIPGSNRVKPRGGFPKFIPAGESRTKTSEVAEKNRVYINLEQYFKGVPKDVWEFQVGGYQVLQKWLKDRRGRKLTYDDLDHYQKIVVALKETMRLMDEIDETIPQWPIE
jgi:predicted helicase